MGGAECSFFDLLPNDRSDSEHFIERITPIGTEVGDYRLESAVQDAQFPCW